jgi:phosphoserine phosphatase RsbU/P
MNTSKVLIAEDDPVTRKVLSLILPKLGRETVVAEDGAQAWEIIEKDEAIRMVVSDWLMPNLDGLSLCKKIRARLSPASYTYFILVTSKGSKANYREAMQAGVDDFLTKPLDTDELVMRFWVADRILSYTSRIEQLEGILPVCSYCKRIQDERQQWSTLEKYVTKSGQASISHGICPECYTTQARPAIEQYKKRGKKKRQLALK